MPAVYSTKADHDNGQATEQLQLSLGGKKGTDPTTRLAIGAKSGGKKFQPWLTINGKSRVTLVGSRPGRAQRPAHQFQCDRHHRTVADQTRPYDPEFTDLLVLAWLRGLQRSVQATTAVKLAHSKICLH